MPNLTADVDFIYEVGDLARIKRFYYYGPNAPSVADHSLRVCFIALILAKREKADVTKVMQMALSHDLTEIRTGDPHPWQKPYVTHDNEKAANDMLGETSLKDLLPYMQEYEARQSLEAKCVKDADMITALVEVKELQETGSQAYSFLNRVAFKDVYNKLKTDSAKEIYKALNERSPFSRLEQANSSVKSGKLGT